jgi:hypothetical protein
MEIFVEESAEDAVLENIENPHNLLQAPSAGSQSWGSHHDH